jgi:ABC-2 type transport system permease protein
MTVLKGALLSYKALFTWLNPLGYLSSRVIRPVGMAIAFISVSSYYGAATSRMLIGSSLLAGAGAVIYGMALSVGNERSYGTLGTWLATPQSKLGAACQRGLPHAADGIIGGMWTYLACGLLYGQMPLGILPFTGTLILAVITTTGFGLSLSALALVVEDLFIGPNFAELLLMLLTGMLVPFSRLPPFLQALGNLLPITHIMTAVTERLANGGWDWHQLLMEAATGVGWFIVSSCFMLFMARMATRRTELA